MTSGNKSIAGVENMIFTNKKANDTMKKYTVAICKKEEKVWFSVQTYDF